MDTSIKLSQIVPAFSSCLLAATSREREKLLGTANFDRLAPIPNLHPSAFSATETPTAYADITSYGNFTEFGSDKGDPARYAGALATRPWTVVVDGECEAPGRIGIEEILSGFTQEERIYRLRCVETWANVNPKVDHPRWSQARERVIGAGLLAPKKETRPFNGYADQVAGLYAGMDLAKFY